MDTTRLAVLFTGLAEYVATRKSIVSANCLAHGYSCQSCLARDCIWGMTDSGQPACAATRAEFYDGWKYLLTPGAEEHCPADFTVSHDPPTTCPPLAQIDCPARNCLTFANTVAVISCVATMVLLLIYFWRKRVAVVETYRVVRDYFGRRWREFRGIPEPVDPPRRASTTRRAGRNGVPPPVPHPVRVRPQSPHEYYDAEEEPGSSPRRSSRVSAPPERFGINPFRYF